MCYSKILEKKSKNIEDIISNVSATLAVENLQASQKAKEITRKYLEGTYDSNQAILAIKLIYLG